MARYIVIENVCHKQWLTVSCWPASCPCWQQTVYPRLPSQFTDKNNPFNSCPKIAKNNDNGCLNVCKWPNWQMSQPENFLTGNCPNWQISQLPNVSTSKCQKWYIYQRANVLAAMSQLTTGLTAKCHNCPMSQLTNFENVYRVLLTTQKRHWSLCRASWPCIATGDWRWHWASQKANRKMMIGGGSHP